MYREIIEKYAESYEFVKINPPADEEQIREAEKFLGAEFPIELKRLLSELNGDCYLLLSSENIVRYNKTVREGLGEVYEGLENLLFFAENGCGDYWGYRIADGVVDDSEIILWDHETNETTPAAKNLSDLINKYYSDEI